MIFCPAENKIFALDLKFAPVHITFSGPLLCSVKRFYRVIIYKNGIYEDTRIMYYSELKRFIRYHELVEK